MWGRVTFTEANDTRGWFQINWLNGDKEFHTTRILTKLEVRPESEAPVGLKPKPPPKQILVVAKVCVAAWRIDSIKHIHDRLQQGMPGEHDPVNIKTILDSSTKAARKAWTTQTSARFVHMLVSVIDFRKCRVMLDPFAGNRAVAHVMPVGEGQFLCLNDFNDAKRHFSQDPLEIHI